MLKKQISLIGILLSLVLFPKLSNAQIVISPPAGGVDGTDIITACGSSDTQVLFTDGTSCAGDSGLTWTKTTDTLQIASLPKLTGVADDANSSEPALVIYPASGNFIEALVASVFTNGSTWTGLRLRSSNTGSASISSQIDGSSSTTALGLSAGSGGVSLSTSGKIELTADTVLSDGKALRTNTTTGNTVLFQVYDNDTGPGYVTWMTETNGNTPSVVIAPPAGGTTISVTSRYISSGAVPAVTDTSANSCGSGTQTIAGNDNAGKVTVIGSVGTSCTVTFATAFANAPSCTVSNETTANLSRATSTTGAVILAGTFLENDVLAYSCLGR